MQHRHQHQHLSLGNGLRLNSRVHLIAYEAAQLPDPPPAIRRVLGKFSISRRLGADAFSGLLEFAEGVSITEGKAGDGWMALQLAATFGQDSTDFEARLLWVRERPDLWRRIAADPLANLEWAYPAVANPLAALAAVFEWVNFLDTGFGMVSRLPVVLEDRHLNALTLSAMPPTPDAARLRGLSCAASEAREAGIEVCEDEAGTFATHAETAWSLVHFLQDGLRGPWDGAMGAASGKGHTAWPRVA